MNAHRRRLWIALTAAATLSPVLMQVGCQSGQRISAEQRADSYLEDAQKLIDEGLTDAALATLGLAIEENPTLTEAYFDIASIHKQRGDYTAAEQAYDTVVAYDAFNFDANYGSALMKQITGRVRDSIRAYLKALAIRPESFEANRDLASAYLQVGEPDSALPYAQRATNLDPDAQPAWSNLAVAYALMNRWDDAINAYRMAAELGDLDDPVLLGLADAHIRLGNYGRAINVLDTLSRRNPTATAWERLGYSRFKLRQFERALEAFDAALALSPKDVASLNGKGVAHMTLHLEARYENPFHKQQALESWRKSLSIAPKQDRIVELLSRFGRK